MNRCLTCNMPMDVTPNTRKEYCGACDGPPVEDPIVAIAYVLCRVQTDPNFHHYMIGTESFARLCKMEAKLCDLPYLQVRAEREQTQFPEHRPEADITIERCRKELIRRAIEDGYENHAVLDRIKELLAAGDHQILGLWREAERGALIV